MPRFVQLQTTDGGIVLVNPDLVRQIAPGETFETVLHFDASDRLTVRGDVGMLLSKLSDKPAS